MFQRCRGRCARRSQHRERCCGRALRRAAGGVRGQANSRRSVSGHTRPYIRSGVHQLSRLPSLFWRYKGRTLGPNSPRPSLAMPADTSSPTRQPSASHPYAAARPRAAAASTTAARRDSQPKSTRQQFAACGACRMRRYVVPICICICSYAFRVKCDLKDVSPRPGETPMCTNCQERGLKCVYVRPGLRRPS